MLASSTAIASNGVLTRRRFAFGCAAMISAGTVRHAAPARLDSPLPIPKVIDIEKHGKAANLRIASGRHAFLKGKPATTYGYSAPVLGPVIRVRRGDELEMAVENALD